MNRRRMLAAAFAAVTVLAIPSTAEGSTDAIPTPQEVGICADLFDGVYPITNPEPLAICQWGMAIIGADADTRVRATGAGVTVGILDSGVDLTHPDIAPNLDLDLSCSFITSSDPLADPSEVANGDCSIKTAVQDLFGHGTHVASIVGSPINGIGVAGVAPEATLVALKACSVAGFCFIDEVAAALRYAGDQQLDIVNMSLFADPFLYYCGNDAEQRAMLRDLQQAARYAQQQGVLLVSTTGNQQIDLRHPVVDTISPDFPPNSAIEREVRNNCRIAPAELPGVVTVSATGPVGYPGYTMNIADYSSVGGDVAAPGGDYFSATGTVQDAVLAAVPPNSVLFQAFDPLNAVFPGITVLNQGATYAALNGTSMASPHTAGVAALIKQLHPNWSPSAVASALERSATAMSCPPNWQPLGPADERFRCYGGSDGHTSFFGHGLVNADAASQL